MSLNKETERTHMSETKTDIFLSFTGETVVSLSFVCLFVFLVLYCLFL